MGVVSSACSVAREAPEAALQLLGQLVLAAREPTVDRHQLEEMERAFLCRGTLLESHILQVC